MNGAQGAAGAGARCDSRRSRRRSRRSIAAPLVFIGYGLTSAEAKYDDFDSPEVPFSSLKGKIVVYINGGPGDFRGR